MLSLNVVPYLYIVNLGDDVLFTGDEYRDVDADMYSDTSSMTGVSAVSSSHSRSTGLVVSTLKIHYNLLPESLTEITP
mgnify:CR=1 FL=1